MNPFEEESLPERISRYICEVKNDAENRKAELVLILLGTFGVWGVGVLTLLTWPLRHLQ